VIRIDELAKRLGAELRGDPERQVSGVRPLDEAGPEHLSFLHNPKYLGLARSSSAGAILTQDASLLPGRDVLVCAEPYLALARALEVLYPAVAATPGVHPSAVVSEGVEIAEGPYGRRARQRARTPRRGRRRLPPPPAGRDRERVPRR
jgi:UDP-3-O-[3-hydroxymyristoyl] glucosamine N-acyltransferase